MKIAIDARFYSESGIGRYIRGLISQLQLLDLKNEYFILLKNPEYQKLEFAGNFHKILADFPWYGITEQLKMPKLLNNLELDLVHFPHFNVPFFYSGQYVVTIHDLIHQHFQMKRATTHNFLTYKMKQLSYGLVFKNAINKSENILVPSNYVKNLLMTEWKVTANKIIVTPEAVDDNLLLRAKDYTKDKGEKVLNKFEIQPPYLFYVGNAHPHKNIEGLIKAFLILRKKYQYLTLVLSGNDHYFWQKLKKEFKDPNIIYTGFITDTELICLYKNAQIFVMSSFEEGFGIPLLEAFANEVPVVAANSASLPEVGGNAAIYFDPYNIDDMVAKIQDGLNNQKLRKELVSTGEKRFKQFSWEKLAKQTLEVYLKCE